MTKIKHSTISWINLADDEIEVHVEGLITPRENDSDAPGEVELTSVKSVKTDRQLLELIDDDTYQSLQNDLQNSHYKQ